MRRIALVFAGGFSGTLARYFLSAPLLALAGLFVPGAHASFPYDILAINLSGACALGVLYGLVERGFAISPDLRLTLGTGFLGAYTTFSSLAVGGDMLYADGRLWTALVYYVGSVALGVLSARIGYILAARDWQRAAVALCLRSLGGVSTRWSAPLTVLQRSWLDAPREFHSRRGTSPAEMDSDFGFQNGAGEEDELAALVNRD